MNTQHDAVWSYMKIRIPLYLAGFIASAMGVVSFAFVLLQPAMIILPLALLAAGFAISWAVRAKVISESLVASLILLILFTMIFAVHIEPELKQRYMPLDMMEESDFAAAILLMWLMVALSFRLATDTSVLFLCVPSLSLISLLVTFYPSSLILIYFGVFLAITCFVMIQQNTLARFSPEKVPHVIPKLRHSPIKTHLGLTTSISIASLSVGLVVGLLFYPMLTRTVVEKIDHRANEIMSEIVGDEFVPVSTGPVNLSNQEVFKVKSDKGMLWRGQTFNRFTGQGWSNTPIELEDRWIRPDKEAESDKLVFQIPPNPIIGPQYENTESETVKQTFYNISGIRRIIHAAAEPTTIYFDSGSTQNLLRFRDGGLESGIAFGVEVSYTAISQVSDTSARYLMTASQNYPERIKERYLSVPVTSWRVNNLTQKIIDDISSPYSKAITIQTHLEQNYAYDTNSPASPSHEDAVVHFLFNSKRGYCDVFASAMVIMARQAGIPARWVTGYAPGEYNAEESVFVVRAKDKHAWAELYFPEYGWIPFDATPVAVNQTWPTKFGVTWDRIKEHRNLIIAGCLIIALLIYLLKVEFLGRYRRGEKSCDSPSVQILDKHYQIMCQTLSRYGYSRQPSVTPHEFAHNLRELFQADLQILAEPIDSITADFVEYRYSGRSLSEEKAAEIKDNLRKLNQRLKSARKQKMLPQAR